ncbi:MAG: alpha/beta hydrolase [Pseudomonadota bacterium]
MSGSPDTDFNPTPLDTYRGEVPDTPDWFKTAVTTPFEERFLEVDGAAVRYQIWGDAAKPGLLLVHGNGAHAHWWDFIAPYLLEHHQVAAMTFSGMGDSEWRDAYSLQGFADEQMAVLADAGFFKRSGKPIICAHSFGGFATFLVAAKHGDKLGGTITVDTRVNPPGGPEMGPPSRPRGNRVYPTLTAALARFRLAPPQPCENHFILDYIARHSLKESTGDRGEPGWTWKFDPGIWQRFTGMDDPGELLRATGCRTAIVRGEQSILVRNDVRDFMLECLGGQAPFISIPHAQHHVMLDQPLAFVAAVRTILADWRHSTPKRTV